MQYKILNSFLLSNSLYLDLVGRSILSQSQEDADTGL